MCTRLIYFLFLVIGTHLSTAQIKISANPTGEHQKLIEKAKAGKRIYAYGKQLQRDSIALIKRDSSLTRKQKRQKIREFRRRVRYEKKLLKEVVTDTLENHGVYLPDSISYPPQTGEDSLKWALQVLANEGQVEEIKQIYDTYYMVDTLSTDSLGYLAAMKSAEIAESFLPEEVRSLKVENAAPDPTQLFMSDIPADQLPHQDIEELVKQVPNGNVDDAVESLSNLKSKYTDLPDLRYPEKGIKKNSLKGQGIRKRIELGGNVAIQSTDPLTLDVDVQLGFKLTKRWTAGTGLIWREAFNDQDSIASGATQESGYGYSVFSYYRFYKNFFGYSEYGGMINRPLLSYQETATLGSWQYQWLIGIGNEIELFKFLKLTMILAYDLNHKKNDLHTRPFVFKFGYRISDLPLPFARK